ncbi:LacI family DNA-binding transcriptional regulator [Streptomyces sp. NBC_01007]|nr:LacI family DNA-binding transcriptional regulator [Streptomyces sp. NBC_01007]
MAAAAGVSVATVCYILNEVEGKRVDTGTRQCVWEAARLPCAASAAAAVLSFRFVPGSPLRSRERISLAPSAVLAAWLIRLVLVLGVSEAPRWAEALGRFSHCSPVPSSCWWCGSGSRPRPGCR